MPIALEVLGKEELLSRLTARRNQLPPALRQSMFEQMARLASYVKSSKLEGQALHHRTGNLTNSVFSDATGDESEVKGVVGTGAQAPYAHVHEDGGAFNIPSHTRTSKLGNAFTVRSYIATFPQRAFLRPSLNEKREEILSALKGTVGQVLSQ